MLKKIGELILNDTSGIDNDQLIRLLLDNNFTLMKESVSSILQTKYTIAIEDDAYGKY